MRHAAGGGDGAGAFRGRRRRDIAPAFSLMLAKATGCSVVSASSSCSRLESGKWRSAPGSYDEKLQGGYFGFTESTSSGTKEKGMDYEPF